MVETLSQMSASTHEQRPKVAGCCCKDNLVGLKCVVVLADQRQIAELTLLPQALQARGQITTGLQGHI